MFVIWMFQIQHPASTQPGPGVAAAMRCPGWDRRVLALVHWSGSPHPGDPLAFQRRLDRGEAKKKKTHLVGGDWNMAGLWLSIQLGIWSPQLTNSIIFQRGRYTTRHWRSQKRSCRKIGLRRAFIKGFSLWSRKVALKMSYKTLNGC